VSAGIDGSVESSARAVSGALAASKGQAAMLLMWLFWIFVLVGGFFMGGQALRMVFARGADLGTVLNAFVWLGCGVAALPRVWKLVNRPAPPAAH
jgi:hypothetical protein